MKHLYLPDSRTFFVAMLSSLIALVGCTTTPTQPALAAELSRKDVTTAQINYQLFDFVTDFSRTVEQASEQIASSSPDATVRRNALLWKLHAIPACYLATEHSDPLAILVDLWALCLQQAAYFASGAGKSEFANEQTVAIQASRKLEGRIFSIAVKLVKPEALGPARKEIAEWTEAHPLENHLFARTSIITVLVAVFPDRPPGIFESLNSVPAELADFKGRMALYADMLPRQARWQAELLADQTIGQHVGAQLTNAFRSVALEREAIVIAINRQRIETLEAVRTERIAALQSISDQRVATLDEARKIMQETLADVGRLADTQREAIVQAVSTERKAALADIRANPLVLRHDVEPLVISTVDRIFSRVLLLLGIGYGVLLGTAYFWWRLTKSKSEEPLQPGKTKYE